MFIFVWTLDRQNQLFPRLVHEVEGQGTVRAGIPQWDDKISLSHTLNIDIDDGKALDGQSFNVDRSGDEQTQKARRRRQSRCQEAISRQVALSWLVA